MYWTVIFKPCGGQLYARHCVDGVYDNKRKVFNTKSTDYTWQEKDVLEFTLCKILTAEEYFEYRGIKNLYLEGVTTKKENTDLKSQIPPLDRIKELEDEIVLLKKHIREQEQRALEVQEDLLKEQVHWHSLLKDPNDLPVGYDKEKAPDSYLVYVKYTHKKGESGYVDNEGNPVPTYYYKVTWCRTRYYFDTKEGEEVIAWCNIPTVK